MTRPGIKTERRISFNKMNAEHLYEYLVAYWAHDPNPKTFGNCDECRAIGARLEKFIGVKSTKRVQQLVKDHPPGNYDEEQA